MYTAQPIIKEVSYMGDLQVKQKKQTIQFLVSETAWKDMNAKLKKIYIKIINSFFILKLY